MLKKEHFFACMFIFIIKVHMSTIKYIYMLKILNTVFKMCRVIDNKGDLPGRDEETCVQKYIPNPYLILGVKFDISYPPTYLPVYLLVCILVYRSIYPIPT